MIKVAEMTKEQFEVVERFKAQHDITAPVSAARFFWNAQEQVFQIEEIETIREPFEK